MAVYYDRTLGESLFTIIKNDYKWLIDFVKSHQELDFQTGSDKNRKTWFSIYRGTGCVLKISTTESKNQSGNNKIHLSAYKKYKELSDDIFKNNILTENTMQKYIDNVNNTNQLKSYYINKKGDKKEGYYQTLIGRRYTFENKEEDKFIIIDKELVLGYSNTQESDKWNKVIVDKISDKIGEFRNNCTKENPSIKLPKNINKKYGEFDFLGLDWYGNIIIMELKQLDSQKTYLSPIQVSYYKEQFIKLLKENQQIYESIKRMVEQKIELGLIKLPEGRTLPEKLTGTVKSYVIVGDEDNLSQEVCRRYSIAKNTFDETIEAYTSEEDGTLRLSEKLK